jgi:hypothetical protein
MDPDPAIFVIDLQDAKNNFLTNFSANYFLKVHLHHFSKIKKVQRKPQNSRIQGFYNYFCLTIEGSVSGAGSGSIPLTSGSDPDPGGPKTSGSDGSGFGSEHWFLTSVIEPELGQ